MLYRLKRMRLQDLRRSSSRPGSGMIVRSRRPSKPAKPRLRRPRINYARSSRRRRSCGGLKRSRTINFSCSRPPVASS
jgi:hypothetical protein